MSQRGSQHTLIVRLGGGDMVGLMSSCNRPVTINPCDKVID